MFRADANRGKVRTSHGVSLPDCTVYSKKTRNGSGNVSFLSARNACDSISGGKVQTGFRYLFCRSCLGESTVLDAFSCLDTLYDATPTSNRSSSSVRSGTAVGQLDKDKATQRAGREIMLRSLGATGTTGRTLVRDARIGTIILGIRPAPWAPAAAVSAQCHRFVNATASRADHLMCGQPVLSSFGKYSTRFGRAQSSEISKGRFE